MNATLPWVPRTANRRQRLHRFAKSKERQVWRHRLLVYLGRGPGDYQRRCRLIVRVYRKGTRVQDKGNFFNSLKPIEDALQDLHWIYEDTPKWLEDDYAEYASPKLEAGYTVLWVADIGQESGFGGRSGSAGAR